MELSWASEKRKKAAKNYAKKHNTTISKIVQDHFDALCAFDDIRNDE